MNRLILMTAASCGVFLLGDNSSAQAADGYLYGGGYGYSSPTYYSPVYSYATPVYSYGPTWQSAYVQPSYGYSNGISIGFGQGYHSGFGGYYGDYRRSNFGGHYGGRRYGYRDHGRHR